MKYSERLCARLCLLVMMMQAFAGITQPSKPLRKSREVLNPSVPFNYSISAGFNVLPNGSSSYSIPLDIPPGTNQVQPKLSIEYSSQSSNGLLGVGFSIAGLSVISRTGATVAQDGFRGGINFNAADRFTLNGKRLMVSNPNGGAYFSPGATYYSEENDWSKVVANARSGEGPLSFTVYDKSGSQMEYGSDSGSRELAQGADFKPDTLTASVKTWLLSRITSPEGNSVSYSYTKTPKNVNGIPVAESANDGTAYPDAIYYTQTSYGAPTRKIQFLYESRPDTLLHFSGGSKVVISVRLKSIQTFVFTSKDTLPGYSYIFNYDSSPALPISRLLTVVRGGTKGGFTEPLQFNWSNGANGLAGLSINWGGPSSNFGYEGDFNGDGKTDLMPVSSGMISSIYYSTGQGFTEQVLPSSILVSPTTYLADYNADGLPDLLVLQAGMGSLYLSTGNGLAMPISISFLQYNSDGINTWIADFNGDGMADLLSLVGTAGYLYLAEGTGFAAVINISNLAAIAGKTFSGDFNGDGQADLYSGDFTGGTLWLSDFSQTNAFLPPITTAGLTISDNPQNNLIADFNSDGLTDILTYTGIQYNLYYANGKGFANAVSISNIALNITQNWLSDFNGDGRMDFYTLAGNEATIYYYSGAKFYPSSNTAASLITGNTWSGDFNGDGIADLFDAAQAIIFFGSDSLQTVASNQVSNLLTGISNGRNGSIRLTYKPITDSTVYTAASNQQDYVEGLRLQNKYNALPLSSSQVDPYPFVRTQAAQYVVQQFAIADGRGEVYRYLYKYAGSLSDINAYGWLGFQKVVCTDSAGENITISDYLQAFPLTGRLQAKAITDMSGNLLRLNRNFYTIDTFAFQPNSRAFQSLVGSSRTDYYDYGAFRYTTGVDYRHDVFGNLTLLTKLGDTAQADKNVYTISKFTNDTTTWHIGYLLISQQAADSIGENLLTQTGYEYYNDTYRIKSKSNWLNTMNSWLKTRYFYDAFGNAAATIDPAGDTTQVTYDSVFHTFPNQQLSPPNQWNQKLVNTTHYDAATGAAMQATDANGNILQVFYDQFGRDSIYLDVDSNHNSVIMSRIFYSLTDTAYSVRKVVRKDWAGLKWDTTEMLYDGLNRNFKRIWRDPDHRLVIQLTAFNSNDKKTLETLPFLYGQDTVETTYQYDPYQRIIKITAPGTDSLPVISKITYLNKTVLLNNAIGTPDSSSSVHNFDYFNGGKRTIQRTDETGLSTAFAYDLVGHKTVVTDPSGLVTKYAYNSFGDVVNNSNPAAGFTYFLYDYMHKSLKRINNKGDTISFFYDALKRKISVVSPSGTTSYLYDLPSTRNGMSNLCKVVLEDSNIYYDYGYDAHHQQTSGLLQINGQSFGQKFVFNPDMSVSRIQYPDRSVQSLTYYDNGYLKSVSMADKQGSEILEQFALFKEYNASALQQQIVYGNGIKQTTLFTPLNQSRQYTFKGANGKLLVSKSLQWNRANELVKVTDSLQNYNHDSFLYDKNGRLRQATGLYGKLQYTYDAAGNMLTKDSLNFLYQNYQMKMGFNNNKKVFANSYDANGNLESRTTFKDADSLKTIYNFDAANRLKSIVSAKDTLFTFLYNQAGRRLIKKDHLHGINTYYISPQYEVSVSQNNTSYTKYVCQSSNIIASVTHSYPTRSKKMEVGSGTLLYYHQDFVNSTKFTSDRTGNTINAVNYKPYGEIIVPAGKQTAKYLFGSKELDSSGLYYFDSRYYDPYTSRFITPDNIVGTPFRTDAYNRYAYTLNNPVKYYDPSGHVITALDVAFIVAQVAVDIATDGAATLEEMLVDEILEMEDFMAENSKAGEKFLKALKDSRTSGSLKNDQLVKIYKAKSELNSKVPYQRFVVEDKPGYIDRYGNSVFRNQVPERLEMEMRNANIIRNNYMTEVRWPISEDNLQKIGRVMSINEGHTYNFTLSTSRYELRLGYDNVWKAAVKGYLKHPVIEGQGNDVYTAGEVILDDVENGGRLIINADSGHYQTTEESLKMSEPIWRMMRAKGYLQFNKILYYSGPFPKLQ